MADKDAVLAALQERHCAPIVPLELPEDDEITAVEEAIYVQIRGEFRDFLLCASDLVVGRMEPVTVSDPSSHTYLPEVASNAWAAGLPRELLPICAFNEGFYCLDLEDQVIFWQHGQITGAPWQDIWEWAQDAWLHS